MGGPARFQILGTEPYDLHSRRQTRTRGLGFGLFALGPCRQRVLYPEREVGEHPHRMVIGELAERVAGLEKELVLVKPDLTLIKESVRLGQHS
jgi:hypothetical protein